MVVAPVKEESQTMPPSLFSEKDIAQIHERGKTPKDVLAQMGVFIKGFPHAVLGRPCTVGDGIKVLDKSDFERLQKTYDQAAAHGRTMKFVPASGAASRMFKALLSFHGSPDPIPEAEVRAGAEKGDKDCSTLMEFMHRLESFAFHGPLSSVMERAGLDIEGLLEKKDFKQILEYTLSSGGLELARRPKGLIPFHRYPDHLRTPVEEHLEEAARYVSDRDGRAVIHFTVSPEHLSRIQEHVAKAVSRYNASGIRHEVTYSLQKPSTDTIAVDMDNAPFRNSDGELLFRPGGHGALLENLNDLQGDIVFIKNIDNVVPDRLKEDTTTWKKALGGCLIALQDRIFECLEQLSGPRPDQGELENMLRFVRDELYRIPPAGRPELSDDEKMQFLITAMNRPIRVCGMVRNVGEPGGGPFWVEQQDGTMCPQIIESSQVDMASPGQKAIWESSTHFNPVDLVCGVRDYRGKPFDLRNYVDPLTGFISIKSKDGKELKALELPGLWNGAMAHWNTVFVEVPIITFNPVKTIMDLLRKEHQPA